MPNHTLDEEIMVQLVHEAEIDIKKIAFNQGLSAAKLVSKWLKDGVIGPNETVKVLLNLKDYSPENYLPAHQQALLALKDFVSKYSEDAYSYTNYGLGVGSLVTASRSGVLFYSSTNPLARKFYAASIALSGTATASSCAAGYARQCSLSRTAMATETIGFIFMKLGDYAEEAALKLEGRMQMQAQRKRRNRNYLSGNSGASFGLPPTLNYRGFPITSAIRKIPFQKIGQGIGFSISVYFYGKLVFTFYSKIVRKLKLSKAKRIAKKASLTLIAIHNRYNRYRVSRALLIYKMAIS